MYLQQLLCIAEAHLGQSQTSMMELFEKIVTQPAFTCSKLTIETPEQGVKYVQT